MMAFELGTWEKHLNLCSNDKHYYYYYYYNVFEDNSVLVVYIIRPLAPRSIVLLPVMPTDIITYPSSSPFECLSPPPSFPSLNFMHFWRLHSRSYNLDHRSFNTARTAHLTEEHWPVESEKYE